MTPYYSDDQCTIYCGDCREILPTLPKCDLLLTDPPYGIGYGGKRNSVGGSEGRARNGWRTWFTDWDEQPVDAELLLSCVAACDSSIVWGGNYFANNLPASQCWLIWDKCQREFSLADAELAWTSFDKAVRAYNFSRGEHNKDARSHPTQKPVQLMRWCIGIAGQCETILDPFLGSGTTLVAAKLEGRKAIGIEINERYCEIAAKRLSQQLLPFEESAQ